MRRHHHHFFFFREDVVCIFARQVGNSVRVFVPSACSSFIDWREEEKPREKGNPKQSDDKHTAIGAMSSCSLSSSSSSSITTTEDQRDGLVPGEESAVRAWLVAQGFRSAEIRREEEFHDFRGVSMHP